MLFTVSLLALLPLALTSPIAVKRQNVQCGSNSYTQTQIQAAANAAYNYVSNGQTAGGSTYPHQYKDYEGFSFGGDSGPYYEFPLLASGKVYTGGSPGPDRVIIDQDGYTDGEITHTGASGNNFVACSGTS